MNSNGQHPNDDIIERELVALRETPSTEGKIGDAVLAMRAAPAGRRLSFKWPVGIGAAAAVATAVIVLSATPRQAYAGELGEIAANMENQPRKYQKSYIYFGDDKPQRVTELWLHANKSAFREYGPQGQLIVATLADREFNYHYFPGSDMVRPAANKDHDWSDHFRIDSIDALLESEFFKKNQTEKKSGVMLNGKACDYYSFAKGYYRVWVDPETKLPLQREIYDKGVTLWERDVYEYPPNFPDATFEPYRPTVVPYFDFPDARNRLEAEILASRQVMKVGDVTIALKAVVKDPGSIVPIWTTDGQSVKAPAQPNVEIVGGRPGYGELGELTALNSVSGLNLLAERSFFSSTEESVTVKIAAWTKDRKLAGWATFTVPRVFKCPDAVKLLVRPSHAVATATATKED